MPHGTFVISLDFELLWGVRDKKTIEQYGANIRGVHTAIPRMLETFKRYGIRATFSTVGFLFFENKEQLVQHLPETFPSYTDKNLSPYEGHLKQVGTDAQSDPYHYAPHLIRLIQSHPEHEIGSHTFSHYYCLEEGQTIDDFKTDLQLAQQVAASYGIQLTSLIFPRNQFNNDYLEVCTEQGILCYRGNERSPLYTARSRTKESLFRRALRLMDAYVNISGHNCYSDDYLRSTYPVNIPSSRFLRPFSKKFKLLDSLRLQRIKSGMTHAAKNRLTYHLWWHPHNFGVNQEENIAFLEQILYHYTELNTQFHFQSETMSALAKRILTTNHK